jgi:hypothetical protein
MMEEKEIVLKSSSTELHQALNLQRKAQQFTDVTLTVNGVSLLAHRNVLSANSSYFSRVLTKLSQCPHPVIVLNELSPQVMSDLLECIYTGQVTIKQKDLEAFVRAAESLKVQLTLPPLATSEPSHEVDKRGCEEATITNRPRSQNGGRKGYQPKRLRISTDSGTFSGSTASFEGHPENVSPDSTSIRSFHSGSHRSPSQASSNEERPPIHEEEDLVKGDADHSAATVTEKNGLPSASSSGHLAAAQSLAWLGASKLGTPTASENLQVAMPSTSVAAKMAPSLPLLSMDIAGQLQKAFWAAKLSQDNPYGAWMNHSASSSFAAAATAASGTPGVPQSMDELSRMAHSASPSALAAAGMLDLSSNAGSHSPLLAVSKAGRASFRGPARGASV